MPPKNLVEALDAIVKLEARVTALDAYVTRNDARISALEQWGATEAQTLRAKVDAVQEEARRARWLRTLRR